MNKYIGLFLVTCINFFLYKYMYGRKMSRDRFLKETIILPKDENGNLDWKYMENYIKQIPYGDVI